MTATKRKPIVGETLWSLNVGNAARSNKQSLTEFTVLSVGRKYFTCTPTKYQWPIYKYHIETWYEATDYSATSALYESKQEWEDDKEASRLRVRIREVFSCWGRLDMPLCDLREIAAIVNRSQLPEKP